MNAVVLPALPNMDSLRGLPAPFAGERASPDLLQIHRWMAKSRALEERLVKMTKSADAYFWIGGPGEEAFNVPLGMLVKKGEGLDYDYLHLHYRSSAIMTAMGMEMIDAIRQGASKATDPFSGGRNFVNHFAVQRWNVVPGTSTIETQYAIAPGTALAQLRHGGDGITIVNGGDAGTAEGDFSSCLNWVSRPGRELPVLMIVTNNHWGISTPLGEVRGERPIAQRAEANGIRWDTLDGNDPEVAYETLSRAFAYVRRTRRPFCLEAFVSRLHGHSSSSGGARVDEPDCLTLFEGKLIERGLLTEAGAKKVRDDYAAEALAALEQVRKEPAPDPSTIFDHTYAS